MGRLEAVASTARDEAEGRLCSLCWGATNLIAPPICHNSGGNLWFVNTYFGGGRQTIIFDAWLASSIGARAGSLSVCPPMRGIGTCSFGGARGMSNPEPVNSSATATGQRRASQDYSQTKPSTYQQLIKWALNQARRNLVDLSRRNRLLHAPLSGKRPWCMAIVGHSPDELFDKLYRQENSRGYAFKAHETDGFEDANLNLLAVQPTTPQSTKSARRPELQTHLTADKLEKRLTKIFRDERTLAEEQGVSTLYLALGFLKWFDSEQSEESFAPLESLFL